MGYTKTLVRCGCYAHFAISA